MKKYINVVKVYGANSPVYVLLWKLCWDWSARIKNRKHDPEVLRVAGGWQFKAQLTDVSEFVMRVNEVGQYSCLSSFSATDGLLLKKGTYLCKSWGGIPIHSLNTYPILKSCTLGITFYMLIKDLDHETVVLCFHVTYSKVPSIILQ